MGTEISDIALSCYPTLIPDRATPIRLKNSGSLKFDTEAKSHRCTKARQRTVPNFCTPSASPHSHSKSNDMFYCFEPSLSPTLSRIKQKSLSIQIPQSSTTPADHIFKEAVIKRSKQHQTSKKYSKKSYDIRLKQHQQEKDVLQQENDALRKRLCTLQHKYDKHGNVTDAGNGLPLDGVYTKTISTDTDTEKYQDNQDVKSYGPIYELLTPTHDSSISKSPTPVATNWSPYSPSTYTHGSPSGYSHLTAQSTTVISYDAAIDDIADDIVNEEEEEEYVYITKTMRMYRECSDDDAQMDIMGMDPDDDDDDGHCVEDCASVKRIIEALQWYSVYGDDHESVWRKMKANNYGAQVRDDYRHIMEYHLEENDNTLGRNLMIDYHWICEEIGKYVRQCGKLDDCKGYKRYLRWGHLGNTHAAKTEKQYDVQMFVNTIDGMHCCFLHLNK